ncbi:uncharacterized protein LOC100750203 [Bombus impatiens]|uniref:Uncharacterized protein LOC100750203 n=1 Tax=Bombus impatiens TaxID=132113 RepID=A0A6P6FF95_BOMIM|nr:uncharacterized protein LOC100750203 [Bombus impatiens]
MNNTSIHVQIYKSDKCIYEKNNSVDASNLNHLISCLNATQIEINDFLTSLVVEQGSSIDTGILDRLASESDSDFENEVEVNPKKSKLTD